MVVFRSHVHAMCTQCSLAGGASRWLYFGEGQPIDVIGFDHLDGEGAVVGEPQVEDWAERHEEVEGLMFCLAHAGGLRSLVGRTLSSSWLVWDLEDDAWFSDCPVVLDFDGLKAPCRERTGSLSDGDEADVLGVER